MLRPDANIAVVAPSGGFDEERLLRGMAIASDWGFVLHRMPSVGARWRYLAGDDATRRADLDEAFSGAYEAVWMARGGYGLARLLRGIDLDRWARVPLIGFSDGTTLLNVLAAAGRPAVHGPVLTSLGDVVDDDSRAHLRAMLLGAPVGPMRGRTLVPGTAEGRLIGGNLCLMASACGTPWQVDARGAIVVIEEVGEAPYRVDRYLRQLLDSGALGGAAGFAVGELRGTQPPDGAAWGLDALVLDALGGLGAPIVVDLPIGHGPRNRAFPVGVRASLGEGALCW